MRRFARGAEAVVRLLRPEFWVVSVFPAWVGWSVATGFAVPDQPAILAWIQEPSAWLEFDGFGYVAETWRVWLAILTLGPFLGGSIMVTNDYFDRRADVFNPKKIRSPLVAGTATPRRAKALMVLLVGATIVTGFLLDPWFGALLLVGEGFSFLYSAPPVRFKARPWGDAVTNAIGYGGLCTVAGWVLGAGPGRTPFPMGPVFIVSASIVAGYLPTVMMDVEADRRAGLRTTAVTHGLRACWIVGFECVIAANLAMAGLAWWGAYVPREFIFVQAGFFAAELVAYLFWVRRTRPEDFFMGAGVTTTALFANLGAFLLVHANVVPWP